MEVAFSTLARSGLGSQTGRGVALIAAHDEEVAEAGIVQIDKEVLHREPVGPGCDEVRHGLHAELVADRDRSPKGAWFGSERDARRAALALGPGPPGRMVGDADEGWLIRHEEADRCFYRFDVPAARGRHNLYRYARGGV
jgi:hypothetical protein